MEHPVEPLQLGYNDASDTFNDRSPSPPPRKIPESALSALRGILVSSLQMSSEAPVPRARQAPGRTSSEAPPPPPIRRRPRLHVTFESRTARVTAGTLQLLVFIYNINMHICIWPFCLKLDFAGLVHYSSVSHVYFKSQKFGLAMQ